jgi:hypothetical protein
MTQALDISERVAYREEQRTAAATRTQAATRVDKRKIFVVTFGIAFAIIYTLFERWNWPLFTYHPAVNRFDLFREVGIPEDGPPMFWYGWLVLSAIAATPVAALATALPIQSMQRATLFFCVLAALWPIFYAAGLYIDEVATFNAAFLRSVWASGVPALMGAIAAAGLVSAKRAERMWTSWLMIMPIGGLIILGYSLLDFFER